MSGSGVYSLNWPHHETERTVSVRDMLAKESFVDVTLACDDDQLEAHKVLLSAASPFFHKILQRNPYSHPLLYLRGSLKKDVSALLNFIYSGETLVPVEDLETFMSLGRDLEVKGLVDEMDEIIRDKKKPTITKTTKKEIGDFGNKTKEINPQSKQEINYEKASESFESG